MPGEGAFTARSSIGGDPVERLNKAKSYKNPFSMMIASTRMSKTAAEAKLKEQMEAWNQESLFKKLSDVPMQFEADPTQHTLATTKEWEKANPKRGGAAFAVLEYER
mmetsp:Transcript_20819/g.59427  ORF Transcript_20819/g.59427 Transcript_20819/m.59427 type:complete len:107 (+) Transcript_20819:78-398(+)